MRIDNLRFRAYRPNNEVDSPDTAPSVLSRTAHKVEGFVKARPGVRNVIAVVFIAALLFVWAATRSNPHSSLGRRSMRWSVWLNSFGPSKQYEDAPATMLAGVHADASASGPAQATAMAAAGRSMELPELFPQRRKGYKHARGSCEHSYGNSWLRSLIDAGTPVCEVHGRGAGRGTPAQNRTRSQVTAYEAGHGSRFYWMRNVALDFNRIARNGVDREFLPGFVQGACAAKVEPVFMGGGHDEPALSPHTWQAVADGDDLACDEWVTAPTLVIQHDDIGNNYHNLADFWRLYVAAAVAAEPSCEPSDGTLGQTTWDSSGALDCPSGYRPVPGAHHSKLQILNLDSRIMCSTVLPDGTKLREEIEDCDAGPYFPQYSAWFGGGLVRAASFGRKRVCFSHIGWAASLPYNQIWQGFNEETGCDEASAIFRQYLAFTVASWALQARVPAALRRSTGDATALHAAASTGARPYFRIGYIVRKKKPFAGAKPITVRMIGNEDEFVQAVTASAAAALQVVDASAGSIDVDLVPLEFTGLPYPQQLEAVRDCHILIGMHGAGMVHGIHLADGDECGGPTSVIEVLDLPSIRTRGIQHLVGMAGHGYYRWANSDASREVEGRGTIIDLEAVGHLVSLAVQQNVRGRRPGCPQ